MRHPPAWLRALARLLPRDFQEEFGDPWAQVAAERIRTGRSSALREGLDLVRTLAREWMTIAGETIRRTGTGGWEPMGTLLKDVRFALRMLWKTPVVTVVSALSLALGIAATASMLALANGFLFSTIPFPNGEELVSVWSDHPERNVTQAGLPNVTFDHVDDARGLAVSTALTSLPANLTTPDGEPERIQVVEAEADLLEVLQAPPALGRGFVPEDAVEGAPAVVILLHPFWERRFLGDRDVLGQTVDINGEAHTVIGVMPEWFEMIPANVHLIRPTIFDPGFNPGSRQLVHMSRLAPGTTIEQFQAEVDALQVAVAELHPDENDGWTLRARYFSEVFPGPTDTRLVQILVVVSLFGLLIACANVANLLLGRAEQRQREVAVRTALGAGRGRIVTQLLVESLVLAAMAGGLGIVGAYFFVGTFGVALPPEVPSVFYPSLTPGVILLSCVVTLGAGIFFGLAPALHAARGELRSALGGSRGGTASRSRKRLRNAFVIGEFAVALTLLTGAAILMQAFNILAGGDGGFESDGVVTFSVTLDSERYPDGDDRSRFHDELLASLTSDPSVTHAAAMFTLPRARNTAITGYEPAGVPVDANAETPLATINWVSPAYLETLGIDLIEGRFFEDADRRDTPQVTVISQSMAQELFPGESPIGRRLRYTRETTDLAADGREIVGVVEDVAQDRLTIASLPNEVVYVPIAQSAPTSVSYAIRGTADVAGLSAASRSALRDLDATIPLGELQTLDDHVATQLSGPRIIALFLGGMGAISLFLAAMGIYGVMAHSVVQRTREIGIRMAMGAEQGSVVGMITKNGMALVSAGLVLGLPLSFLMFQAVKAALAELTEVLNPLVPFMMVAGSLTIVATLACLIPALRASGIAPVRALGQD